MQWTRPVSLSAANEQASPWGPADRAVSQFRQLCEIADRDRSLTDTLKKVLKLSKGWETAREHVYKAVGTDNRMRCATLPDSAEPLQLSIRAAGELQQPFLCAFCRWSECRNGRSGWGLTAQQLFGLLQSWVPMMRRAPLQVLVPRGCGGGAAAQVQHGHGGPGVGGRPPRARAAPAAGAGALHVRRSTMTLCCGGACGTMKRMALRQPADPLSWLLLVAVLIRRLLIVLAPAAASG